MADIVFTDANSEEYRAGLALAREHKCLLGGQSHVCGDAAAVFVGALAADGEVPQFLPSILDLPFLHALVWASDLEGRATPLPIEIGASTAPSHEFCKHWSTESLWHCISDYCAASASGKHQLLDAPEWHFADLHAEDGCFAVRVTTTFSSAAFKKKITSQAVYARSAQDNELPQVAIQLFDLTEVCLAEFWALAVSSTSVGPRLVPIERE